MGKFFGSISVADTQKRLDKELAARDAQTASRAARNKEQRNTGSVVRAESKAVAPKSTKKRKKGTIIKVDRNVKPITGTPSPVVAIVQGIRNAFAKAKEGAAKVGEKVKEVAVSSQKGDKVVDPTAKRPPLPVGAQGPLPNLLNKRRAAKNRKINLGGDRAVAGRSRSRARPPLAPKGNKITGTPRSGAKKKKTKLGAIVGGIAGATAGVRIAQKLTGR
jgi:hypothetical protein